MEASNIDREKAVELLHKYVKTEHIIPHSYAVEAVMRKLAERVAPDRVDEWGIAGLLHDLDEDLVPWREDMSTHGPKTVEMLREISFGNEDMYNAILAHNPANGSKRTTDFEWALYAADPITGFIRAIAMVYPDKKIKSVKVKSITKRMKETRFAAGASRVAMNSITKIGIDFPEFAKLALEAMQEIDDVLGL